MTVPSTLLRNALYRIDEIRQIEAAAAEVLPAGSLMRAAGSAATAFVKKLIPTLHTKILVLAGPGNNGGDALEVTQLLSACGYELTVILCADRIQYSEDAKQSLQRAQAGKAKFIDATELPTTNEPWALVIDGLFGIGLTRAMSGTMASLIQQVNQLSQQCQFPVLALDVPSGLNADTGQLIGDIAIAIRATHTITFIGDKPGLHTAAGRDYCGHVVLSSLEIPLNLFPKPSIYSCHPRMFSKALQPRMHDSHKGSNGDVLIVGGATGMIGAPLLAARSAIHCGVGRVYVGFVGRAPLFDNQHPELMCRAARDYDFSKSVVVIGPGLGDSSEAMQLLTNALNDTTAIVIDADALNLIATTPRLQKLLLARAERNVATIITPHPLEAARLLGISVQEIQSDRLKSAQSLADKFKVCAVLKGSGTIIASVNEPICINTTGNPALATAGTGDVLAGICGALLAQLVPETKAARMAVWLHGLAADNLLKQGIGPVGLTASELIPAVRTSLNKFITDSAHEGMIEAE